MRFLAHRVEEKLAQPGCFRLLAIAFSALGAALILAREATYGVALFWDSIYYISVARNLLEGEGLTTLFGHTLTLWPPLYPILLAVGSFFVFDPHDVAGPLNAIIFGLTVFAVGQYLQQRLALKIIALSGCLAVVLSVPLAWMASWALFESLFILLATLSLIHTDRFLRTQRRSALIWAAIYAALALSTRYMGIALPATAFLAIALQRGIAPLDKAKSIIGYSIVSITPIGLWVLRNILLGEEPTGSRYSGDWTWFDLAAGVISGLSKQFMESSLQIHDGPVSFALGSMMLVSIALAVILSFRAQLAAHSAACQVSGLFVLIYMVLLLIGLQYATPDGVQPRFLTPVYVPIILMVCLAMDRFLKSSTSHNALSFSKPVAAVILLFLLVYSLPLTVREIHRANAQGIGVFNDSKWHDSAMLKYIEEHPMQGHIVSNEPLTVYMRNTAEATYSYLNPDGLGDWVEASEGKGYFVWFYPDASVSSFGYRALDLMDLPGFASVIILTDGILLRAGGRNGGGTAVRWKTNEAVLQLDPNVNSVFDLYLDGNLLYFVKEPCSHSDIEARFFLHVFPKDTADLPSWRKANGFYNLDFHFDQYGVMIDGRCVAAVQRPAGTAARIVTGQFVPGEGRLWESEFRASAEP